MKTVLSLLVVIFGVSAAWADGPAVVESPVLDAADLETLRAKAGTDVIVEGAVTDIGTTKDAGITFVNIGMPKKKGFVAIVFRSSYAAFPEGFDKFRNQKVRVTGVLKLYQGETPQVELKSPEQITIVTE